ncbi:MAG: CvpA family protein [Armatimonadetes bacterium]|nr:CvpA family protein [Armatimonadota bacterium]
MTWVDPVVLFLVGIFVWVGTRRGFVKETFEFLMLTVSFIISSHMYPFLAELLTGFFKTPPAVAGTICFIVTFALIGVLIFLLGAILERIAKLDLASPANMTGGGISAFAKGFVLMWFMFLFVSLLPISEGTRQTLGHSFTVGIIQSQNSTVVSLLQSTASSTFCKTAVPVIEKSRFAQPRIARKPKSKKGD